MKIYDSQVETTGWFLAWNSAIDTEQIRNLLDIIDKSYKKSKDDKL